MFVQAVCNVSYDRVKTEKIGDFFALTWLIFTGLVTYSVKLNFQMLMGHYTGT